MPPFDPSSVFVTPVDESSALNSLISPGGAPSVGVSLKGKHMRTVFFDIMSRGGQVPDSKSFWDKPSDKTRCKAIVKLFGGLATLEEQRQLKPSKLEDGNFGFTSDRPENSRRELCEQIHKLACYYLSEKLEELHVTYAPVSEYVTNESGGGLKSCSALEEIQKLINKLHAHHPQIDMSRETLQRWRGGRGVRVGEKRARDGKDDNEGGAEPEVMQTPEAAHSRGEPSLRTGSSSWGSFGSWNPFASGS